MYRDMRREHKPEEGFQSFSKNVEIRPWHFQEISDINPPLLTTYMLLLILYLKRLFDVG